jgi:glutathione S-transferase
VTSAPVLWTSTFTSGSIAHQVACVSGVAFAPRFISLRKGDHRTPDFLAVNPKGQVPALQLPDGTTITEVPAILFWFAEAAPDAALLPRDATGRAKAVEWLAWCHWSMGRDFAAAFNPRFFGGEGAADSIRSAAMARAAADLDLAETVLAGQGGTLLGTAQPTVADIYLAALAGFAVMLKMEPAARPALAALIARVHAMPGVAAAIAREKALG